ncbi:MAG TPA: TolC family protein [Pyrinomonadaceae bacterium]
MASGKLLFISFILLLTIRAFPQTDSAQIVSVKAAPNEAAAMIDDAKPLTLAEAIELALKQASNYKAVQINEQIAAEDIKQARANFYPKITAQPNLIYTSPSFQTTETLESANGNITIARSRPPSFLGANAVTEYQAIINAAGEIDTSGKLKATLERSRALLESARRGSEIARLELVQTVADAYFNLALATTKRRGAEMNLAAAQEFEANTKLLLDAGEVAPVDLIRARLQTAQRRDESAQAQTDEIVSADALRFLVGFDFNAPVAAADLLLQLPLDNEIERYTETAVASRPEFAQFEADKKVSEQDIKIAQADRRPQINYSVSSGFISDSLRPNRIANSTGVQANVGVTIPIFDRGASRSRERQAKLKIEQTQINRRLAERRFVQQFYAARIQATAAAARIRQLGDSIRDAEANLTASLARYRAGEAAINEVTDAQNLLIAQRQALYQAIFDYQTARARLLRAIGQ